MKYCIPAKSFITNSATLSTGFEIFFTCCKRKISLTENCWHFKTEGKAVFLREVFEFENEFTRLIKL